MFHYKVPIQGFTAKNRTTLKWFLLLWRIKLLHWQETHSRGKAKNNHVLTHYNHVVYYTLKVTKSHFGTHDCIYKVFVFLNMYIVYIILFSSNYSFGRGVYQREAYNRGSRLLSFLYKLSPRGRCVIEASLGILKQKQILMKWS